MLETRKKEVVPDASYDLDGDGFVGGRDYVVARRFDEGFKNYLTPDERQKAIDAVKDVSNIFQFIISVIFQGYEEKFIWNVEASGAQRQFRIMQKRGMMVDSDDFQGVGGTYPEHPLGEVKPDLKTCTELT